LIMDCNYSRWCSGIILILLPKTNTMKKEKIAKDYYVDWFSVAPGVWGIRDKFVNVYLVHNPQDNSWVLVDAGLKTTASKIKKVAEKLFWPEHAPKAIILTHGHFDHVGSLQQLAEEWDVKVYAHKMEEPYLKGISSYPPPDPSVGGGMMSYMSFVYPKGPINIGERFQPLPEDGTVPFLPEWNFIHTPGHAPGHVSFFRKRDGVLLAGDAFVTTCQESAFSVMTQKKKVNGPPKYFTYNWSSAETSVKKLEELDIQVAATGHGKPMSGDELRKQLHELSVNFMELAVPSHGRYIEEPAYVNQEGVQYLPPPKTAALLVKVVGVTVLAIAGILMYRNKRRKVLGNFSLS
jgi:glyoxylase-like metal-dependent hydrolase (beta-lactamase superfamily II)